MPWRAKRWLLVDRLHWTLDEVEALDATDYLEAIEFFSALDAVRRDMRGGNEMEEG